MGNGYHMMKMDGVKMEFVSHYECTLCQEHYDQNSQELTCPKCGEKGILEICYDYEAIKRNFTKQSLRENSDPTMWRYQPLMSVVKRDFNDTLKVGGTPLYQSIGLSKKLGLEKLYLKDEGLNPTASLKDRASAVAVMKAIEAGALTIACSSTGNAASSCAGNAARLGLTTVIFVPKRAPKGKLAQLLIYGATVVSVEGDYNDTFELSKEAIEHFGWYNRNAAINPHLVEGKKTVAFEIAEQLDYDVPDWVVVSVGDGCTIASVYKGFYDLLQIGFIDRMPRLLGVQAEGCAPLYKAFITDQPFEACEENTLADSISVGVPRNPIKALKGVKDSKGTMVTVADEAILEAMRLLGREEGIFGEPAGVVALAGLLVALKEELIKTSEKVCVIITGNGLKDITNALLAAGEPIRCPHDLTQLKILLKQKGNNQ